MAEFCSSHTFTAISGTGPRQQSRRATERCTASALPAVPPARLLHRHMRACRRRQIDGEPYGLAAGPLRHAVLISRLEGRQTDSHAASGQASRVICAGQAGASEESPLDSHSESEAEESLTSTTSKPVSTQGLQETKKLVEVAMLAAVTGLAYFMANIIKVEGYIGYVLPLPSVIAAMRWGAPTGWRTVLATCFLISVLLGPVRMLTYLCMHGLTAGTMAWMWSKKVSWVLGIGTGLVVRTAGLLGYICISSWAVNENLFQMLLNNIYSLLDQILATAGSSIIPSKPFVVGTCGVFMAFNGFVYMLLISVLYAIILRSMGYDVHVPARIHRMMYPPGHPLASM